jgi:integrase
VGKRSRPKRPAYRPYSVGEFRLGWWRNSFCVTWYENGERRRYRLGVETEEQARTELHAYARIQLAAAEGTTVPTIKALKDQYIADLESEGKPSKRVKWIWTNIGPTFGHMRPVDVTRKDCKAYEKARKGLGRSAHTVYDELNMLRIIVPQMPAPRDRHLTRQEVEKAVASAMTPHVQLFMILALCTAARKTAILQLTWDRIDFDRGLIYLQDPEKERTTKGRAIVPMNDTARAALTEARTGAVSDYVIEWAGSPVTDVKRGVATALKKAGLKIKGDGAHLLRHTAGVFMAEDGVEMAEIAQYLGHTDLRTTYRIYARFSPSYLKKAAGSLELPSVQLRASDRRFG